MPFVTLNEFLFFYLINSLKLKVNFQSVKVHQDRIIHPISPGNIPHCESFVIEHEKFMFTTNIVQLGLLGIYSIRNCYIVKFGSRLHGANGLMQF